MIGDLSSRYDDSDRASVCTRGSTVLGRPGQHYYHGGVKPSFHRLVIAYMCAAREYYASQQTLTISMREVVEERLCAWPPERDTPQSW
jgi:hypothetical protein